MKRFFLTLALLPVLAGCGSNAVTYTLATPQTDEDKVNALLVASMRVIERRMASIGEEVQDINLNRNNGLFITVQAKNQTALDVLTEALTAPFDFVIMKEAGEEEPEVTVEGHGGFVSTGITGEQILWLQASEEDGGKGRVTISFSEEGRNMMSQVFKENFGKSIGIFVRGQLVSKLSVETDELKEDIIITDIPTTNLAEVFADDVNVGLYVTFTPND